MEYFDVGYDTHFRIRAASPEEAAAIWTEFWINAWKASKHLSIDLENFELDADWETCCEECGREMCYCEACGGICSECEMEGNDE